MDMGNTFSIFHLVVALVPFAVFVAALVTLIRARNRLTSGWLIFWILVIVFLPLLGSLAWLFNWATTKSLRAKEFSPAPVPPLT